MSMWYGHAQNSQNFNILNNVTSYIMYSFNLKRRRSYVTYVLGSFLSYQQMRYLDLFTGVYLHELLIKVV